MNQDGTTIPPHRPWGPIRIVYLQYASDAVTFFDYRDLYREPAWMKEPRGPDVSPELQWYPVVTRSPPPNLSASGDVFAPQHYVDLWIAVTGIRDWSADEVVRLKQHLAAEQKRALEEPGGPPLADRGG